MLFIYKRRNISLRALKNFTPNSHWVTWPLIASVFESSATILQRSSYRYYKCDTYTIAYTIYDENDEYQPNLHFSHNPYIETNQILIVYQHIVSEFIATFNVINNLPNLKHNLLTLSEIILSHIPTLTQAINYIPTVIWLGRTVMKIKSKSLKFYKWAVTGLLFYF